MLGTSTYIVVDTQDGEMDVEEFNEAKEYTNGVPPLTFRSYLDAVVLKNTILGQGRMARIDRRDNNTGERYIR